MSIDNREQPFDSADEAELRKMTELLFFAYRDFTADPDQILAKIGFGRAHHRVIHFVGRHPGMTVAELLNILGITKQSLARVLRQLLDRGLVVQRPGDADRRQRLLSLTEEGKALEAELAAPQKERLQRALEKLGPEGTRAAQLFLATMINQSQRSGILIGIDQANDRAKGRP